MASPKFIRTCSIWRALEVVGDTSILLILEASWIGARRFDEFRARTGLLQTLLSDRLKRLVAANVLEKVLYSEAPPRYEYRMTQKGRDLYWPALMMLRWERRWTPTDGRLQLRLRHKTCGHVFEPTPTRASISRWSAAVFRTYDTSNSPGRSSGQWPSEAICALYSSSVLRWSSVAPGGTRTRIIHPLP